MEANQEMRLTIHFAINVFSVPQIFFIPQPKHPPDGWITDNVMKFFCRNDIWSSNVQISLQIVCCYLATIC